MGAGGNPAGGLSREGERMGLRRGPALGPAGAREPAGKGGVGAGERPRLGLVRRAAIGWPPALKALAWGSAPRSERRGERPARARLAPGSARPSGRARRGRADAALRPAEGPRRNGAGWALRNARPWNRSHPRRRPRDRGPGWRQRPRRPAEQRVRRAAPWGEQAEAGRSGGWPESREPLGLGPGDPASPDELRCAAGSSLRGP
jgi:hypothetical protein